MSFFLGTLFGATIVVVIIGLLIINTLRGINR
jgi:hypothetical protein